MAILFDTGLVDRSGFGLLGSPHRDITPESAAETLRPSHA
jgi:hypothetical protein